MSKRRCEDSLRDRWISRGRGQCGPALLYYRTTTSTSLLSLEYVVECRMYLLNTFVRQGTLLSDEMQCAVMFTPSRTSPYLTYSS